MKQFIKIYNKCKNSKIYVILLPFIALLMVAESIGKRAPHRILLKLDKLAPLKEFKEIAYCYRSYYAEYTTDLQAFEAMLEGIIGYEGRIIGRSYTLAYNIRGNKLSAVNEFTTRILDIFKNNIVTNISLVREAAKLVAIVVAALVLGVSFAAFISTNITALLSIILLVLILSIILILLTNIRRLVWYVNKRRQILVLDAIYAVSLITGIYTAFNGYGRYTLIPTIISIIISLIILNLIRQNILNMKNIIIVLREIGDSYTVTGRMPPRVLAGMRNIKYNKNIIALLASIEGKGAALVDVYNESSIMWHIIPRAVSKLIYGGTYKHIRIVEKIVETIILALKEIKNNTIYLNFTMIIIYLSIILSAKMLGAMVFAAQSLPAPTLVDVNNVNTDSTRGTGLLILVDTVTIIIASTAITYTLIGSIAAPAAPIALILHTALYQLKYY